MFNFDGVWVDTSRRERMQKPSAGARPSRSPPVSHLSQAQILIGQTAGFTGPAVGAGVKETTDGAKLYIDAVNAKGGVNGQKIELISLDDKLRPQAGGRERQASWWSRTCWRCSSTRGTPHTEAILPLLAETTACR
jgi:branched-chain amino acid transport system substrate-binding protein